MRKINKFNYEYLNDYMIDIQRLKALEIIMNTLSISQNKPPENRLDCVITALYCYGLVDIDFTDEINDLDENNEDF